MRDVVRSTPYEVLCRHACLRRLSVRLCVSYLVVILLCLTILYSLQLQLLSLNFGSHQLLNGVPENGTNNKQTERTSVQVFLERTGLVHKVCASQENLIRGGIQRVFTDSMSGVVYCVVPKTGCTFWKRVFEYNIFKWSFLRISMAHSQESRSLPQLLTRRKVQLLEAQLKFIPDPFPCHPEPVLTITLIARNPFSRLLSSPGTRSHDYSHRPEPVLTITLIARNPFSRLLSSYLDKIYLPDFWNSRKDFPRVIRKYHLRRKKKSTLEDRRDFLRQHFDQMAVRFEPQASTKKISTRNYMRCPKYMTFADFVRVTLVRDDHHWAPVHAICNPCLFQPTHISKMETYTSDARVVMDKMGMGHFLEDFDYDKQVMEELRTTVDYNFQVTSKNSTSKYISGYPEIAFRLFQNFQWRGYTHPDVDYVTPSNQSAASTKKDLIRQIQHARELGRKYPKSLKKAKNVFLINAYRTLGKQLFEAIVRKFSFDFLLFGYEDSLMEMRQKLFPV